MPRPANFNQTGRVLRRGVVATPKRKRLLRKVDRDNLERGGYAVCGACGRVASVKPDETLRAHRSLNKVLCHGQVDTEPRR